MAVDLPADERTLRAAILAAALVADPTTAATIEKLIEIEKLSAQPDLAIVSDDGSGSPPLAPTIDHAVVDHTPIEAAATAEPSVAATHIDTPSTLADELAHCHDVLPAAFFENNNEVTDAAPHVTAHEDAPDEFVVRAVGMADPAPLSDTAATLQPSSHDTSPLEKVSDPIQLPNAAENNHDLIALPGKLLFTLSDNLDLKLVDTVVGAAGDLVGGIVHDVAIDTFHLVGAALDAVGDIGQSLHLAILDGGVLDIPLLHGSLLDSLDGKAASAEGSPIPDLISDILPPGEGHHDQGIVPLIIDHALDSLSHHLHLL